MVVNKILKTYNDETTTILDAIADLPVNTTVRRLDSGHDIISIETSLSVWLRIRWRLWRLDSDHGISSTVYSRVM